MKSALAAFTVAMIPAGFATLASAADFGRESEMHLHAQAAALFGIDAALPDSAPATHDAYRTPSQAASEQLRLAAGLRVEYLTRAAAHRTDMLALFPPAQPTHLISCVEGWRETLTDGRLNPSVQRIALATGKVETILRGLHACDGIRTTPWGTILATEETADGGAWEILDPLHVAEQSVVDRGRGEVTDPRHIAKRTALPTIAWEGFAVLENGVVFGGDELAPGQDGDGRAGGAIYKFIPARPRTGNTAVTRLAQSPLTAGKVFALQASCQDKKQQYGQGCEVGTAAWVEVRAARARGDAAERHATGFYRPEDLERDPSFRDPASPQAVRFCWANTGNEAAGHYGEVLCAVDRAPLSAQADTRRVHIARFQEGDREFNAFDNLAFQPGTGNLYVLEDHKNGDIIACLPDGADRDLKSDGCVRVASVTDSSAEPTGLIFSADGASAYVVIQHSNDALMPLVDGYPSDDILRITGFRSRR